jgi:hypothetical protein
MVIYSLVSYPQESAKPMVERFMAAPEIPDFITRLGPYVSANRADGIRVIAIFELDKSRLAEGLEFLGSYFAHFFGIPGYAYEYKPYFELEEALKTLGM